MPESERRPPEAAPGGSLPGRTGEGSASPDAPRTSFHPETAFVGVAFAAASIFFGIFPTPLFTFAAHAGRALTRLF